MIESVPSVGHVVAWLDQADARACGPDHVATLRALLADAVVVETRGERRLVGGGRAVGRIGGSGSVALYVPAPPDHALRHRLLDLDRRGHVTLAVRRGPGGSVEEIRVRNVDGALLGVLPDRPGGTGHPLWGPSDRIVRLGSAADPELLTLSGAVDWTAIAALPPLAEPARLPPGAGTSVLNVLASLAADQGAGSLRYRGPYPTEQLFWALVESFRFDPAAPEPLARFTGAAEALFVAGESHEAPLDWTPAPHERLFVSGGRDAIYVQLRDGVEKVVWQGRPYYRRDWQGLNRREHRVIRAVAAAAGGRGYVAGLQALGRPIEDHLVLDPAGEVLDRPDPATEDPRAGRDRPLDPLWVEALGALLPLEATPLLADSMAGVWPALRVVWGPVPRDLIEERATTLRLSTALAAVYRAERARRPASARRALAQRLVREILGLLGSPVRRAAALWLEAQAAPRRAILLEEGAGVDRREAAARAAQPLQRLLDALEAGAALPA